MKCIKTCLIVSNQANEVLNCNINRMFIQSVLVFNNLLTKMLFIRFVSETFVTFFVNVTICFRTFREHSKVTFA